MWGADRPTSTRALTPASTVAQFTSCFESGLRRHAGLLERAAVLGREDLVQCALECGCLWSSSVFARAAEAGQQGVIEWACRNGKSLDRKVCMRVEHLVRFVLWCGGVVCVVAGRV